MSDEDFKLFLDDLTDYLSGQEATIVRLRAQIQKIYGETKPSTKLPFDVSKIRWQNAENARGKFEVSHDYSNSEHRALLKFLADAGGCRNLESFFYWTYGDGSTIGRKSRKPKNGTS